MCYAVSNQLSLDFLSKKLRRPIKNDIGEYKQEYVVKGFVKKGMPQPLLPVISNENPAEITLYSWKLIPHFVAAGEVYKANTLNARNDTLFELGSYRNYWQNRCLIMVSGFWEPHYEVGKKTYESYYIRPSNDDFFYLGGIYSINNGLHTCTIITTSGSPRLTWVHNDPSDPGRHPLILSPDLAKEWVTEKFDRSRMAEMMLNSFPDEKLEAFRTIDGVYSSNVDTNRIEATLRYQE
ncbi:MAG: SOS response-associated peptidase family protein [Bacteroidota bacterium]